MEKIPEPGNAGEKMTGTTSGRSFGKSVKEFWHALLLIVPITLSWIWFLIKKCTPAAGKKIRDVLGHELKKYG
jgi:hypothetical protein